MIRAWLLKWTARMLLVSLLDVVDWDALDPADWFSNERLAAALDWDDVDLREHVTDEDLAAALEWDNIDVYDHVDPDEHLAGPVERLHQLDDDEERAYVWQVPTPEAERQVTDLILEAYRDDYGRDPKAAHFVVHDLEQLRDMDEQAIRLIDPVEEATT